MKLQDRVDKVAERLPGLERAGRELNARLFYEQCLYEAECNAALERAKYQWAKHQRLTQTLLTIEHRRAIANRYP